MKKFFLIIVVISFAYYTAYITSGTYQKKPLFSLGTSPLFYKAYCIFSGETDTTNASSLYSRAVNYSQQQNYLLAIADYKRILSLDSSFFQAYSDLSKVYLTIGDTSLAIFTLNNFALKSDYPDTVYAAIGLIYQNKGVKDSTIYFYKKAIEINRNNYTNYYRLADYYFSDSIYDMALENINQAITLNQTELDYRNFRRNIYIKLNKQVEADDDYQYIITNNPSYFGKFEEYAKTANDSGNFRAAVEYYKLALVNRPNNRTMLESRAWAYHQLSEFDSSYMDYLKVSQLEPDYLSYFNVAYILDVQDKIKESIEFYNKSISLKDDYYISYNNRGYEYFRLKKYKEAESDYTKSINLKPDYYLSNYNRGTLYAALNKHEKAIVDYKNALESENSASIHYDMALSYDKLKKKDEAINSFNEYIKLSNGSDSIRLNYATERIELLNNKK